ncbi:MAG: hypothetical protein IID17_10375 [Nitrospinae bacterium]|nr:hypothetical protein [Nitrospinota bacterium]
MDINPNHGTYVKKELIYSRAYEGLPSVGKEMLVLFLLRQPVHQENNKKWVVTKDADISFPYTVAEKDFGISQPRFTRGLDALMSNGFIRLEYQGGGIKGDCSIYRISQMWRHYGMDKFRVLPRPKKEAMVGFLKKGYEKKTKQNSGEKIRNIRD